MTRPSLPLKPSIVSAGRRRGGLGEPAPYPVPPVERAWYGDPANVRAATTDSASRQRGAVQTSVANHTAPIVGPGPGVIGTPISNQSIFVGAGGMVVTVEPPLVIAACAARGWSLAELGRRAGLSRPTIAQALRGQAVRPKTSWKIRRALAQAEPAIEQPKDVGG
jgi:lambda repressor-like predicted transcriptional regulator